MRGICCCNAQEFGSRALPSATLHRKTENKSQDSGGVSLVNSKSDGAIIINQRMQMCTRSTA
jgi:hypothetical protein